jgi:hypothetical protein
MMSDFRLRTEDIRLDEIQSLFVSTKLDREIVDSLKSSKTIVLEGSRGTGKSFLLRMSEVELNSRFATDKILPVYISFVASSLIHTNDPEQFKHWMLSTICYRLLRSLREKGLLIGNSPATALLSVQNQNSSDLEERFSRIAQAYQDSYRVNGGNYSIEDIPDVRQFRDMVEEICEEVGVRKVYFFFDEAVHIFRQEQQRQFFTLFRDLRSPYITCKAAVYPGVTAYGDTFEMSHDATHMRVERDIISDEYVNSMREIIFKQADPNLIRAIEKYGENFSVLAYSASGNPRMLLNTVAKCPQMKTKEVNEVIKDFYRSDIWIEHTSLGNKYKGHRSLIDWGRDFIEKEVLQATKKKNEIRAEYNESTCYFWIHRDLPELVKEALRLLEYTGIVRKHKDAVRATNSELGTRYELKFGCILALEQSPITIGMSLIRNLTPSRLTEYGMRNSLFQSLNLDIQYESDADIKQMLIIQLEQSVDNLGLSQWQIRTLKEHNLLKIRDILETSEEEIKNKMYYVGEKRARRMRNAALAELLEYLSG